MSEDTKDYEVGYGKPPKATQFKKGRSVDCNRLHYEIAVQTRYEDVMMYGEETHRMLLAHRMKALDDNVVVESDYYIKDTYYQNDFLIAQHANDEIQEAVIKRVFNMHYLNISIIFIIYKQFFMFLAMRNAVL